MSDRLCQRPGQERELVRKGGAEETLVLSRWSGTVMSSRAMVEAGYDGVAWHRACPLLHC